MFKYFYWYLSTWETVLSYISSLKFPQYVSHHRRCRLSWLSCWEVEGFLVLVQRRKTAAKPATTVWAKCQPQEISTRCFSGKFVASRDDFPAVGTVFQTLPKWFLCLNPPSRHETEPKQMQRCKIKKHLFCWLCWTNALLNLKFNPVWLAQSAADRILAHAPVTKWFHHLLLELLLFAMATSNKPPPHSQPFKWQGEWGIAGGCSMEARDVHVFRGRTHARVNAWVAN